MHGDISLVNYKYVYMRNVAIVHGFISMFWQQLTNLRCITLRPTKKFNDAGEISIKIHSNILYKFENHLVVNRFLPEVLTLLVYSPLKFCDNRVS